MPEPIGSAARLLRPACVIAAGVLARGAGAQVFLDNFNDSDPGSGWAIRETHFETLQAVERNGRLEFPSSANPGVTAWAGYVSNGWAIDGTDDIFARVDWHVDPPDGTADVGIAFGASLEPDPDMLAGVQDGVVIEYGRDTGEWYFTITFYDNGVADTVISETGFPAVTDGTFYITYDAASDILGVSDVGYADVDGALVFNASGGAPLDSLTVFVGSFSRGAGPPVAGSRMWVDNVAVDSATLITVPPIEPDQAGENVIWLVDGTAVPAWGAIAPVPDTDWRVSGLGDFNGSGTADILWRHVVTGENVLWFVNGLDVPSWGVLPPVTDPNWLVAGVADFNLDGTADILWRHALTGANVLWFLNGVTVIGWGALPVVSDLNWTVAGTDDFNGDGTADVLWRHEITGSNVLWFINGLDLISWGHIAAVTDTNWVVAGVGDFNGDGRADILWRHGVTGKNMIYLMSGLTLLAWGEIPPVTDLNWRVAGVGDHNGNGTCDIFWRHAVTGDNIVWFVNGLLVPSWGSLPSVPDNGWRVVGTADFDNNGKWDILWRHE